ncbi:hypothetical protein HHI36_017682, partial [Cryptolaemus montrouzieri]
SEVRELKHQLEEYKQKPEKLESENEELKKWLEIVDRKARKNNLVIYGLETSNGDLGIKVAEVLGANLELNITENTMQKNLEWTYCRLDSTDHQPTFLTARLDNIVQKIIPSESKSCINYGKLKSDLSNESWDGIYKVGEPNQMTINCTKILCQHVNRNTNPISMNNKHTPRHKWITKGLLNSINERNRRYHILRRDPENINWK